MFLKKVFRKYEEVESPDHCYRCMRHFEPNETVFYMFDRKAGEVTGGAYLCPKCIGYVTDKAK